MKDTAANRLLHRGHKNAPVASLTAHADASNAAITDSGDDQAPFIKVNPFVTEPQTLFDNVLLTALLAGNISPSIDVSQWRLLTVFINYTANIAGAAVLTLQPEAAATESEDPAPIGVVNATITPSGVAGVRTFYETQLATPSVTAMQTTLAFDVSTYSQYRFSAAELAAASFGRLTMTYVLSM